MIEINREIIYTKITEYKYKTNYGASNIGKLKKVVSNSETKLEDIKDYLYQKFSTHCPYDFQEDKLLSSKLENVLLEDKTPTIKLNITFELFGGVRSTILIWDNVNGYNEKNYTDLKEKDENLRRISVKNVVQLEAV